MKKKLTEESILFISVFKWFILATLVGIMVGTAVSCFLKILDLSTAGVQQFPSYFFLLPLVFFLCSLAIKYLAPDAAGHGTEKVIEAVHKSAGKINPLVVPVKFAASIITLAFGGSAGKEGPCAQIGAGLSSIFADLFRFDANDRRKLVICGISAGFASVFGAPIAGAIFGIEVLFVGGILYDVMLPSFIAGVTSYQVSSALGITYFHHTIKFAPVFSEVLFIKVALAGVFFGLCSFLLVEALRLGEKISSLIPIWQPLKGLLGGGALVVLTLIFSTRYLGLGLETIQAALNGEAIVWYAFLMKTLFTAITLSFGGSGGIITPIFFIGATAGVLFATVLGLSIATFAAIGMVSLLAGAANTPIAASILAIELFGPKIAAYAAVACVIRCLMTGHRSVYPSQVLTMKKSSSLKIDTGHVVKGATIEYRSREKSLVSNFLKLWRRFWPK
ncbi:MAG: chloride channel protein [Candidatus Margulisbacteria bacterium]|nr:chloride channel protein [Candidatus Margulisiibacteriota bacterium]